ncbi:MAG: YihY/virulence factor BrkB family protein [Acidobacteria bacterium]|nr:YihY/virulence factor BrkB family protein [Acidobacteriota bacterium]
MRQRPYFKIYLVRPIPQTTVLREDSYPPSSPQNDRRAHSALKKPANSTLTVRPMFLHLLGSLLTETLSQWRKDNAPKLAASLAFYTLFSLAPVLMIGVSIAGYFFGPEAAQAEVQERIRAIVGEPGARLVTTILGSDTGAGSHLTGTLIGVLAFLVGATAAFGDLRGSLNLVWEAPVKSGFTILGAIRNRFWSFCMVLVLGLFLLISVALSTAVSALRTSLGYIPGLPGYLSPFWNLLLLVAATTLLFGITYKLLPEVKIAWTDVGIGAAVTALLFSLSNLAISYYLGHTLVISLYGRAGSLVVFLLWVYWSAHIFFFGAEFTHVYATRFGSRKPPSGPVHETAPESLQEEEPLANDSPSQ